MAAGAFTIVLGYECLRSASASLFREAYGAEALPAVMAAVPVFVLGALWAYNRVLTRFGPRRTLLISQLVSLLLIALSLILTAKGVREARIALYLIKDTYIVLLLE